MLNILIPLAGKSIFFESPEYVYPKPFVEIFGKPMIEWVIANLNTIKRQKRFIFVVQKQDCEKYHLDESLRLLTGGECKIIQIEKETKGAACSALMAIEHVNNQESLVICNADQYFDVELDTVLSQFVQEKHDASVICFESVHPRWSYIKTNDEEVVETAEKKPISKQAIAGFYYFAKGEEFVRSTISMMEKDAHIEGNFYISPAINEMILRNKKIGFYKMDNENYHSFYSPQKIKEFEKKFERKEVVL